MNSHPWRNERRFIQCCNGCVPPKRYPGCGARCPEYIEEKAEHKIIKQREKEYIDAHPTITNYDFNRRK